VPELWTLGVIHALCSYMKTIEQLLVLFFDNTISRIIPGWLVFCLYFPELRHRAIESGAVLAAAIFITIGWGIGLTLEFGSFAVIIFILKHIPGREDAVKWLTTSREPRLTVDHSNADWKNI
jgi:hypothetical protein